MSSLVGNPFVGELIVQRPSSCVVPQGFQYACYWTGSGHNDIPNRLKRHFGILAVPSPSDDVFEAIFGSMLRRHFAEPMYCKEVKSPSLRDVLGPVTYWAPHCEG